jgi:hypothetical protein
MLNKFIFLIIFMLSLSFRGLGQCNVDVQLIGNSACCFDVNINFFSQTNTDFRQITVNGNYLSGLGYDILSAAATSGTVTVNLDPVTNIATFTSSVNLVTPASLSGYVTIGTICLGNSASGSMGGAIGGSVISNSVPPVSCDWGFDTGPADTCITSEGFFAQTCGDTTSNQPTKIKSFGDGVYVTAVSLDGLNYATFSKYTFSGALLWTFKMNEPSIFHDFEYIQATDEFILVGATEPFQVAGIAQNNQSILIKVNDSGNFIAGAARKYQQAGREHFNHIIRHNCPPNPAFPYYILGTINEPNPTPPTSVDLVTLGNIDANLNFNWYNSYDITPFTEGEFHRGLIPLCIGFNTGQVLLTGNSTTANDGMAVKVDGFNGTVVEAHRFQAGLDIYDGVEISSGVIGLVGADFANDMAFIGKLRNDNFPFVALEMQRLPDIKEFREIGRDALSRLYAVGPSKTAPFYNVIHRFKETPFSNSSFQLDYSRYLEDIAANEISYSSPHISVTTGTANIFYADARKHTPSIYGNDELMVGSFDLDLTSVCSYDFVSDTIHSTIQGIPVNLVVTPLVLPTPSAITSSPLTLACQPFCNSCTETAGFNYVIIPDLCFGVQFAGFGSGPGPLTYQWNFGDPGSGTNNASSLQNPVHVFTNAGLFNICLTIVDANGCQVNYCQNIIVADITPPIIGCPSALTSTGSFCSGGVSVSLPPPTLLTDNCMGVAYSSSHQNGSFFPCGTTVVTYTATDLSGNASSCTFPVIVNCPCGHISGSTISCTNNPSVFTFTLAINNDSGAPSPGCNVALTTTQTGISINAGPAIWSGNTGTVSGTFILAPGCIPTNINLTAHLTCICPTGVVSNCNLPFSFQVPCCLEVSVNDDEVCAEDAQLLVPLIGCNTLPDVQQVQWYVAYAPCPPIGDPAWGAPYQVTNGCHDLVLLPHQLTGDVCVYAVVLQGACAGPCSSITSNVANIKLCQPFSCNITVSNPGPFCSNSTPSTNSLTVSYNANGCTSSVEWFDALGNSLSTSNTLNISGVSFANAPITGTGGCWKEYAYRVDITQPCGIQSCEARIRIYDDNASEGQLILLPPDVLPSCPGEDFQLQYIPACAILPPPATMPEWHWSISTDGSIYTPMPTAGNMNPLFVTNKLYQDTWYKVSKQNGACTNLDEVSMKIDLYDDLTIGSLSVAPLDPCSATGLNLTLGITSNTGCSAGTTVTWYKDGIQIYTNTVFGNVGYFTYTDPSLNGDYSGNYYAVIEDNCCPGLIKSNVVTVPKPCNAIVLGPCFRCNNDIVTLTGLIINPPATGSCTYQWYVLNTSTGNYDPILGEIGLTLIVNMGNTTYRFEANCNGCIKTVDFFLKQCIILATSEPEISILNIFPNPTSGWLTIALPESTNSAARLELTDINGRLISDVRISAGAATQLVDMTTYASGIYIIQLTLEGKVIGAAKVIKQ